MLGVTITEAPAPGVIPHWLLVGLTIFAVFMVGMVKASRAEWKPEYAQASPEVRDWYRNAELTPEARKRFRYVKCCDHADVVRTQFRVNKTTKGDEWFYLKDAMWTRIPDDIIHLDKSAPDNQPTLFVYQGQETCFFPGSSGI